MKINGAGCCLGDFIIIMRPKDHEEVGYVLIQAYLKGGFFLRPQKHFFHYSPSVFSLYQLCFSKARCTEKKERGGRGQEMKEKGDGRLSGKMAQMNDGYRLL